LKGEQHGTIMAPMSDTADGVDADPAVLDLLTASPASSL
jgi:hypothetical protein